MKYEAKKYDVFKDIRWEHGHKNGGSICHDEKI
jgi:hypothetical protein